MYVCMWLVGKRVWDVILKCMNLSAKLPDRLVHMHPRQVGGFACYIGCDSAHSGV